VRRPLLSLGLAAAATAALAVAGCGGGGADKPVVVKSKADFVKAGDKICVDRDSASRKLAKSSDNKSDAAQITGSLADIYADAVAKLKALPLPPGAARAGARKYLASVADMQQPIERMKAAATKLENAIKSTRAAEIESDAKALQLDVNTVQAISDLADQNARSYGFHNCGQQQQQAAAVT
jgi:hypothetical protein